MILNNINVCEFCFDPIHNNSGKCPNCIGESNLVKYPTSLSEGSILAGKYLVGKVLGKGGFGVTYLCYDIRNDKKVAIKEYLPDSLAHRNSGYATVSVNGGEKGEHFISGAQKFFEEARLVSRFNGNPNIISVYEFFEENNTAYYVMEYLSGTDMKAYLKNNPKISEGEAIYIAERVLDAFLIIHSTNTIHRDIAPDNIFLCEDGSVKLIDFGASRHVIASQSNTLSIILKHGFAPLEQYQSKGKQGPWTDIYALGVTLYFALTGVMPDDAMTRYDDPEIDMTGISPNLARILTKMMAPIATDRYTEVFTLKADFKSLGIEPVAPRLKPNIKPHYCTECGKLIYTEGRLCEDCRASLAVIYSQHAHEPVNTVSQNAKHNENEEFNTPIYEESSPDPYDVYSPAEIEPRITKKSSKKKLLVILSILIGVTVALIIAVILFMMFNKPGGITHVHEFKDSQVVAEPTCTSEGARSYYCSCGAYQTTTIPKTDHNYVFNSEIEPTCETEGKRIYLCSCGLKKTDIIEKLPHSFTTSKITQNPTCTTEGIRTYYCECGATRKDPISKIPHEFTASSKVEREPTCTQTGIRVLYCECGFYKNETIEKLEHKYENPKVTKEPTATSTGVRTYYCACGKTRTEEIPKLAGLSWSVKSGVLTISGNGAITDTPWENYKGQVTTLVIKEGVTSICDSAFYGFTNLRTVSLPTTLKSIGANAFSNCKSIDIIQIPQGVTSIGASAFYSCTGMKSLYLPNSLSQIGQRAFYGCSALKNIIIDKKKGSIDESIFPSSAEIAYTK